MDRQVGGISEREGERGFVCRLGEIRKRVGYELCDGWGEESVKRE